MNRPMSPVKKLMVGTVVLSVVGMCAYYYLTSQFLRPPTSAEMAAMDRQMAEDREAREARANAPTDSQRAQYERMLREMPTGAGISVSDLVAARGMAVVDNEVCFSYLLHIDGLHVRLPTTPLLDAAKSKGLISADLTGWAVVGGPGYAYSGSSRFVSASNAYLAGVLPGDVVVAINGRPAGGRDEMIAAAKPIKVGDAAAVTVYRSGPGGERLVDVPVRATKDPTVLAQDYRPADLNEIAGGAPQMQIQATALAAAQPTPAVPAAVPAAAKPLEGLIAPPPRDE